MGDSLSSFILSCCVSPPTPPHPFNVEPGYPEYFVPFQHGFGEAREGDSLETILRSFSLSKISISLLLSFKILSCVPRTFLLNWSKFEFHRKFFPFHLKVSLFSRLVLHATCSFFKCQMRQTGRIRKAVLQEETLPQEKRWKEFEIL